MLENDRLKLYFLQIDLENMILAAKNIKMISLVGIRGGPWTAGGTAAGHAASC